MSQYVRVFLFLLKTLGLDVNALGRAQETGIASQYGQQGDIWAMQALACDPSKHVTNTVHVCAHRSLPCGTILGIQTVRTQKYSWCVVMDRGPYGALVKADGQVKWQLKIKPNDPGVWRGILDMSPAVAKDMAHQGFEKIRFWILYHRRPVMRSYGI